MQFNKDDIITDREILPPRIVLYGPEGIGKTNFGAKAYKPIFACTENGLDNFKNVPSFPHIDSYEKMEACIDYLITEDHDYSTLVIDTLDWMEPILWGRVCEEYIEKKVSDVSEIGYGKGFAYAANHWKYFLEGLSAVRDHKNMAIILLAHAEIKRFDSPECDPYDRYQIKIHKTSAAIISEWSDMVLFANYKSYTRETDVGFGKTIRRGASTGARVLYTEEKPAFKAKNRYGLPPEMPMPLDDAHNNIMDMIFSEPEPESEQDFQEQDAKLEYQQENFPEMTQPETIQGNFPEEKDDIPF